MFNTSACQAALREIVLDEIGKRSSFGGGIRDALALITDRYHTLDALVTNF